MSLAALKEKYVKILQAVPEERKKQALIVGNDSIALIRNRIQNKGESAEGSLFPGYSKTPMPFWKINELDPKVSNKASSVRKFKEDAAAKKINPSYETLRQYMGLPTNKRTHTFSGEMMQSIFSEIEKHDKDETTIIIKSSDQENQEKINYNSALMKSNILSLNARERELVIEASRQRLRKLLLQ